MGGSSDSDVYKYDSSGGESGVGGAIAFLPVMESELLKQLKGGKLGVVSVAYQNFGCALRPVSQCNQAHARLLECPNPFDSMTNRHCYCIFKAFAFFYAEI